MNASIFYVTPEKAEWRNRSIRFPCWGINMFQSPPEESNTGYRESLWVELILTLVSRWTLGRGPCRLCAVPVPWGMSMQPWFFSEMLLTSRWMVTIYDHYQWELELLLWPTVFVLSVPFVTLQIRFPSVKSELSQGVQIQGRITKALIPTDWKHETCILLYIKKTPLPFIL